MNLKIITGVVVILLFVLMATTYIADIKNKYGQVANMSSFANTESKLNKIFSTYNSTYNYINEEGKGDFSFGTLGKLAWNSIGMMWSSFTMFIADIPNDAFNAIDRSIDLGKASQIRGAVIALLMSGMIIFFISMLLRWWITK